MESKKKGAFDVRCALCRTEFSADLDSFISAGSESIPQCPTCSNYIILDTREDHKVSVYVVDLVALLYLSFVVVESQQQGKRPLYNATVQAIITQIPTVIETLSNFMSNHYLRTELREKLLSLGKVDIKINALELRMLSDMAQTCVTIPDYTHLAPWFSVIESSLKEQLPGVELSMVGYLTESLKRLAQEMGDEKTKERVLTSVNRLSGVKGEDLYADAVETKDEMPEVFRVSEGNSEKTLKCVMCYSEFSLDEVGGSKGCPQCKSVYPPINAKNTLELEIRSDYMSKLLEWSTKCCKEITTHFSPVIEKIMSRFADNHGSDLSIERNITININGDELFMLCTWSEKWVKDEVPEHEEELSKIRSYIKWKAPWIPTTATEGIQDFVNRTNTPVLFISEDGKPISFKPTLKN